MQQKNCKRRKISSFSLFNNCTSKNKDILTKKSAVFCSSKNPADPQISENLENHQQHQKLKYPKKRCSQLLSSHEFRGHSRGNSELEGYPKFRRITVWCPKVSCNFPPRAKMSPQVPHMSELLKIQFIPFPNYSLSLFYRRMLYEIC